MGNKYEKFNENDRKEKKKMHKGVEGKKIYTVGKVLLV